MEKKLRNCLKCSCLKQRLLEKTIFNIQKTLLSSVENGYYKKKEKNKCWQGCGVIGISAPSRSESKTVQLLWEVVWQFLKN